MENKILFSRYFTRRMFWMAVITGFLMAVSLPSTFFVLSVKDLKEHALIHSQHLARKAQGSILPDTSPFDQAVLIRVLSDFHEDDISSVQIFDEREMPVYTKVLAENTWLKVSERSAIIHDNKVYGYVEVSEKTAKLVFYTIMLLILFSGLGILMGVLLYSFPARFIKQAEKEIVKSFAKLNRLSHYDPLTKLPNRVLFAKLLSQALNRAQRHKSKTAVMFLDLDRFKIINDTLGHQTGDLLLKGVGDRLQECMREGDMVSRLSGDEFILFLADLSRTQDAAKVASRIIEKVAQPYWLNGQELFITTSLGISVFPDDGTNINTLIKHADTAMYKAKELGKNRYQFFTAAMNEAALERLQLENNLRKALANQELEVYYQPIIDIYSGEIVGVEALARWNHLEMGSISPEKFIPVAEETGLINTLGAWILETACRQNKLWQDAGLDKIYVSVNLSARQFKQRNLLENIHKALRKSGLEPKYLQLEITESVAMNNEEQVIRTLDSLKQLGVRVAIDDFGTGYSSLSCIKNLPIDTLKMDKTFIHNITLNPYDPAIAEAIIQMANSLHLKVVAEGVETEAQLAYLLGQGCGFIQGYLFCPPLPVGECVQMLMQRRKIRTGMDEAAVALG